MKMKTKSWYEIFFFLCKQFVSIFLFLWLIWPISYEILMILIVTKYLKNLLRDMNLSLLSIAKNIFILSSLENLFSLFLDSLYEKWNNEAIKSLKKG